MSEQAIIAPIEQEGTKSVVRAWLKKVGDAVKRDEPVVELETDKVAVEVSAPADGVLTAISLNEGDEAAPGATLGTLNTGVAASDRRLPAGNTAPAQATVAPSARAKATVRRLSARNGGMACSSVTPDRTSTPGWEIPLRSGEGAGRRVRVRPARNVEASPHPHPPAGTFSRREKEITRESSRK